MGIVSGHVTVDPAQRESCLASSVSVVENARRGDGCLDSSGTADLVDPGRVNLFERWEPLAPGQAFRRSALRSKRRGNALGVGSRVRRR